jgi:hypothetical protein
MGKTYDQKYGYARILFKLKLFFGRGMTRRDGALKSAR